MLENFVLMELARQLTWNDERARLYHYRMKDKVEVDAVIESATGVAHRRPVAPGTLSASCGVR